MQNLSIGAISMTLSDIWPQFQGHDIFWSREEPKFTTLDMWPPNSPDIKPVDYCILASDAEASLPHADTGHGRAAAEGDELVGFYWYQMWGLR